MEKETKIKRCSACGGPWHPATGHQPSPNIRLCLRCTRDHINWLKQREASMGRPWRGKDGNKYKTSFTDAALTSIKTKKALDNLMNKSKENSMRAYGKEKGDFPEKKVAKYASGAMSAHKRESLKTSQFAIPKKSEKKFDLKSKGESQGRYPINDLAHARNALARAAQSGNKELEDKVKREVYAKYPDLKKRKEEREGDTEKSIQLLNDFIKSAIEKRYIGSFGPDLKEKTSGKTLEQTYGRTPIKEATFKFSGKEKQGPPPIPKEKSMNSEKEEKAMQGGIGTIGGGVVGGNAPRGSLVRSSNVEKAMTASVLPQMPKAARLRPSEMDTYRSATMGLTRSNSRFAKDIHTGPLTGEVIEDVYKEGELRSRQPIYKSCETCGRRYLAKSLDDACPTCSINKSNMCTICGHYLVKSHGGFSFCPICG